MGPKKESVIDETQPEAGFLDSGVKEILFKETHEQVGIGRGHTSTHGSSLYLEVMLESKEKWLWVRMNCVSWIRN